MKKLLSACIAITLITACNKTQNETSNYEVNRTTSVAEWKGAAPDHFHTGSFQVSGSVTTEIDGTVKGGKFIIPIVSIQNFDLPQGVKELLLNHLKSPDFFNIALHPNAGFEITKIEAYTGNNGIAEANKLVTGNFTMTGQTHPITFPARINYTGDSLKVESTFKIDRTKWGMTKYSNIDSADYIIPDADIFLKVQAIKK